MGARTLGGETGNILETVILASSVLYELIGPACAKLSLYLSKSYSNKLEEIVEIPEEEGAEQKTELELLIQRIQAIQEELPKHDDPFYEDERAFSEAAEEHYAMTGIPNPNLYRRKRGAFWNSYPCLHWLIPLQKCWAAGRWSLPPIPSCSAL